ncbi:MAG: hypothetical protein LBB88_10460, partial [Planctomycetaceae bacterium]|nr:hypothetical protein [Planctomycetaceae bacterium]
MKNFLFKFFCNFFVTIITITGFSSIEVFANDNVPTINDELVPLENPASIKENKSTSDSVIFEGHEEQKGLNTTFKLTLSDSTADSTSNSTSDSTTNPTSIDEIQLGNKLRTILARKPEIPFEKIPLQNKPTINNSTTEYKSNYRNEN